MLRRGSTWLCATMLALAGGLAVPQPASADPVFLTTIDAFGGGAISQFGIGTAMAGDGTVVVGRIYPTTEGAVQVEVRRPAESFASVTLQPAVTGVTPSGLELYAAPNGALAAVWYDDSDPVMSMLPAGAPAWTPARPLAGPPYLDGTAMDAEGRLWVGEQVGSGPYVNKVEIFSADGTPESSVTVTDPPNGTQESDPALALGTDGVGRVLMRRFKGGTGTEGSPCTNELSIVAGDVARGTPTASVTTLETRTSSGVITGGSCAATTGSTVSAPMVVVTSSGATVATFAVTDLASPFHSTARAFHRPSGGSWATTPETVIGTPDSYILTDLIAGGPSVVQVVQLNATLDQAVVVRSPSGTWSGPTVLTGPGRGGAVAAAGSPDGGAVFAWHELASPYRMQARTMNADGDLSLNTYELPSNNTGRMTGAGADLQGNAVVTFTDFSGGIFTGKILPFDGSGPRLTPRSVPATVTVGAHFQVAVTPVDVWSPPATTPTWSFDGGTTTTGITATHTFQTPGDHTVTVSSVDALGNTSSATSVVAATAIPDTAAPQLTKKLKVKPKSPSHRKRPRLVFGVNEGCQLSLTLKRKSGGKRDLTEQLDAGKQSLELPKLGAGPWKAILILRDASGNQTKASIRFQVT